MRLRAAPRLPGVVAIIAVSLALGGGCGSSSKSAATTKGSTPSDTATVTPSASTPGPATSTVAPTTTTGGGASPTATSTSQTGGAAAGPGGGGSQAQSCGTVPFVAASSHGAFQISATGASCSTAQAVAGAARNCFGCRYVAQGFHCTGRQVTTGLIRVNYTCIQGANRITFIRG